MMTVIADTCIEVVLLPPPPPPPVFDPPIIIIEQPIYKPYDSYENQRTHTGQRRPEHSRPAAIKNDGHRKETRDSGVQRRDPVVSNPAPASDDKNNHGTRNFGIRRSGR